VAPNASTDGDAAVNEGMETEAGAVTCAACGEALDPDEAVTFKGRTFHDSCSIAERFADPDALTEGAGEPPADVPSAVLEAIEQRGIVVVAHL
jgi:hypothetical protein